MLSRLKEIFEYRDMVGGLVKRDLRGRYKGSFFGFIWNFINPLCQIIVYIIVFTQVYPSDIDKYYIYLISGMMPWLFFNDSLREGSGCVVRQADMTKKIYFPREILPIASVTSRFINMLLTFIVVFVLIAVSGVGFNPAVLWLLPVVMIIEYIFTLGLTLILSAVTVYFRDIEHITGVFLMALIWGTPVMYSINSSMSGWVVGIIKLNPMTHIVEFYHSILYYKELPQIAVLAGITGLSLLVLVIGEWIFSRLEINFAEEL